MLNRNFFLSTIVFFISFFSKAQLVEDYSDGDFTSNPTWVGDNASWQISSGMLRSNGPAVTPTSLQLATSSTTATNCQFQFFCNLKFATSSANYSDVFLISDSANLKNYCSGFFVRIGGTNDEVCLYRKDGASSTKIIDGLDGRVASSTNNLLRVKVTRSPTNLWTLFVDVTGTGSSFITEGTNTDASYPISKFFGIFARYSSTNNQNFYFDDVYAGPIIVDVSPPQLDTAIAESNTLLKLVFDEAVDGLTSEDINNYVLLPGSIKPAVCTRDLTDLRVVRLEFSASFISGTNYSINASNIKDLNNNSLASASKIFEYTEAFFQDIVINEIMADPSPQVGLPDREWVEIYNRSNKSIQLFGFKISDGTTTASFGNYLLKPDSLLIVCSTTAVPDLMIYGPVVGLTSFPSLNNSGDNVTLFNNTGKVIDKVDYTDSWYNNSIKAQGGWTLEVINPNHPCADGRNWRANNSNLGGTPGLMNSVYDPTPDITKPKLKSIQAIHPTQMQLVFDERMDSLSLLNAIITIGNGLSVVSRQVVGASSDTLLLIVSPAFNLKSTYLILVKNVSDCWGNIDTFINDSFKYYIPVSPLQYQLIISEILADPDPLVGLPGHEFVEIYNPSSEYISLKDVVISASTSSATLPSINLAPDSFLILCSPTAAGTFVSYGNTAGISGFPSLANTGAQLFLKTKDGIIVHTVAYSDQWYQSNVKRSGGWSLEIVDPSNPCEESGNWKESINPNGGTPGQKNSNYGTVKNGTPPKLNRIFPNSLNSLILYFSESVDSLPSLNTRNYFVSGGIGIPVSVKYYQENSKTVLLTFSDTFKLSIKYTLTCDSIFDCKGNFSTVTSIEFGLPELPLKGELIINEVLSNPKSNGNDFVELYNNSDKYLNIADLNFMEYDILLGQLKNVLPVSGIGRLMYPYEFLVLTESPSNIISNYPLSKNIIQVNTLPTLADDTGSVVLGLIAGPTIDSMNYSEKMHYALIDDLNGVSLERVSYSMPSNEFTNWQSATSVSGFATPGYLNSKYTTSISSSEILSINPPVFSPDDDGYNDLMNFSFALPGNTYTVNVTVYDVEGRTIKKLVQNQTVGSNGIFSWNGIQEDNRKAPIGIYIVYFEAFNPDGDVKTSKRSFALASKF